MSILIFNKQNISRTGLFRFLNSEFGINLNKKNIKYNKENIYTEVVKKEN